MKFIFTLIISSTLSISATANGETIKTSNSANPIENMEEIGGEMPEFSSYATTFNMFFIPTENELTWESSLYSSTDKYENKVSKIMSHVLKAYDQYDAIDQRSIQLFQMKEPLFKKYEELECDFEYRPLCEEIDVELKRIDAYAIATLRTHDGTEISVDYDAYKDYLIVEIQSSVDDYNRLQPELNRPKNWMLFRDAGDYKIRQFSDKTFQITFPNLGPFGSQNTYSTETGEIYDVALTPSKYNSKVELLTFKIREKGEDGSFTSNVWEFTLEKSLLLGKLRYMGNVLKVSFEGKVLKRGMCKIDFPPIGK